MDSKVSVFIDTNALIHFRLFNEIDWPKMLNSSSIELVIPPVIVKELDEKKIYGNNSKLRDRAKTVLRKLKGIEKTRKFIINGVEIDMHFLAVEPLIEWQAENLDPNIKDDRLIASIIEFRKNKSHRIALVTSDFGLQLKSKSRNLECIELSEDYALKLGEDPLNSEYEKNKKELQILKNQLPDVMIKFADLSHSPNVLEFNLKKEVKPLSSEEAKWRTESLRDSLTIKSPTVSQNANLSAVFNSALANIGPTPLQIENYERDLEKYLKNYPQLLNEEIESINLLNRTIEVTLLLENTGGAPADDIDVLLHFPDGLYVRALPIGKKEIPKPPEKPKNPFLFMNDSLLKNLARSYVPMQIPFRNSSKESNVSPPEIRKTGSYDVTFKVNRIKHNTEERLKPLWVSYLTRHSATSFEIDYKILVANHPQVFQGKLAVILQKD